MRTIAHQPFGKYLLTLLAIGLAGYSMWRLFRAALGHGPEGSDKASTVSPRCGSGLAYGAHVRPRGRDPPRGRLLEQCIAEEVDGRCSRLAGRRLDRRARRGRPGRDRALPGVPRRLAGVPRRLEGRGDAARREDVDRPARDGRASARGWSCSASSGSSSSRLPSTSIRTRRSASTARWPSSRTPPYGPYLLGVVAAGLDRVRALLVQRRALPEDLTVPGRLDPVRRMPVPARSVWVGRTDLRADLPSPSAATAADRLVARARARSRRVGRRASFRLGPATASRS